MLQGLAQGCGGSCDRMTKGRPRKMNAEQKTSTMNSRTELQGLLEDLNLRLAQLDMAGETVAAAHLDAAVCMLTRSLELLPNAAEMDLPRKDANP